MKDCREIREKLSAFIDNELPASERKLVEGHLYECTACAQEESSLRQLIDLMDEIPDESPSGSFIPATVHRVVSWKRCDYVKGHILTPALAALRWAFSLVFYPSEANSDRGRTPVNAYLQSFDDFPPESLSSIYISLIEGDAV